MKTLGFCATVALSALVAAPVMAQETGSEGGYGRYGDANLQAKSAREKAVELASKDSKASLSAICYAVYQAVQADPSQADAVFTEVVEQRTDWTSGQVYAIMRAVLMAHPDVNAPLSEHVNTGDGSEASGETESAEGSADAAATPSETAPVTMADKLSAALYAAELPAGMADSVAAAAGLPTAPAASSSSTSGAGADESGSESTASGAEASAPDAGSADAGASDAGTSDVVSADMVQVNQSVLNGSLGGGVVSSEEIKEPVVTPPSEDVSTPGQMSPQY